MMKTPIDVWNYKTLKERLKEKSQNSPPLHKKKCLSKSSGHEALVQRSILTYCSTIHVEKTVDSRQRTNGNEQGETSACSPCCSVQSTLGRYLNKTTTSSKEVVKKTETKVLSASAKKAPYKCPAYKFVMGTECVVDAFRYGVVDGAKFYFLSHFHFDHYSGLNKSFSMPLYCSKITANLVLLKIKVAKQYVHSLEIGKWHNLADGTSVLPIEANHCPGAVMFMFKRRDGRIILHTGDFRAEKTVVENPLWKQYSIDILYLDTTYCNPSYTFPPQHDAIEETIEYIRSLKVEDARVLIVVGTYTIGKERIFTAIAEEFNCMICVDKTKMQTLKCLEDSQLNKKMTLLKSETFLHVVNMKTLNKQNLIKYALDYPQYNQVVGVLPSGWEFVKKRSGQCLIRVEQLSKAIRVIGVPYSEHSSYAELRSFVQTVRPKQTIPTVNVSTSNSRSFMQSCFADWLSKSPP